MSQDNLSTSIRIKPGIPPKLRNLQSLNAQNTFSTSQQIYGPFVFELTGTWVGTITVQRSPDQGTTWNDVTSGTGTATSIAFTTNGQFNGNEIARDVLYRWGFKTGNFTSGTANGNFQQ